MLLYFKKPIFWKVKAGAKAQARLRL